MFSLLGKMALNLDYILSFGVGSDDFSNSQADYTL